MRNFRMIINFHDYVSWELLYYSVTLSRVSVFYSRMQFWSLRIQVRSAR